MTIKIPKFQVENINVNLLKEYKSNAKKHPKEQIEKIEKSIQEFGFRQPILISNLNEKVIVAGHGRLQAAKKLGLEIVPCISCEDLTQEQIKLYRLMDNKSQESEWDLDFLKEEFTDFEKLGLDLDLTGFGFDEINGIMHIDNNLNKELLDTIYTKKIKSPIYEPSENKPLINDLFDYSKTEELINLIENSNISIEEKEFFKKTATRFIKFNYDKIADFYAHSNKETQEIMEKLALVIIDFNKAIDEGFVKLTKEISETYLED